jgi:hypothetical protein
VQLQVLSGGSGAAAGASSISAPDSSEDGEGKYTLMAVISHLGKSTDHGHYVCHVKKDGQWVLFNDEKVRVAVLNVELFLPSFLFVRAYLVMRCNGFCLPMAALEHSCD